MLALNEILGQDKIKEHFYNAVLTGKISHAYILSGEEGMGKRTLAEGFALSLLCEKGQGDPCRQCHACRQVLSGNHPDLIYVTHEKPASIGVDEIREQINDTIQIKPYSSPYKIYIVDDAQLMTVQAQNALLKTIEEPPAYAVILLLTSNEDSFLPTILSRCVKLKLKPLPDQTVLEYLEKELSVEKSKAQIYTAFARGNLGKAIHLAGSESFQQMYQTTIGLLKQIKSADISRLLDTIRQLKDDKADIYQFLELMQMWYRDVLMYKTTKDINLLIFKDEFTAVSEMAKLCGYEGLEEVLEAIDKARVRLLANVNMELAMELMLLTMKEA